MTSTYRSNGVESANRDHQYETIGSALDRQVAVLRLLRVRLSPFRSTERWSYDSCYSCRSFLLVPAD
ncbi:hypothetical protein BRC68_06375 [Halobacteriales archaeon QH_6_64_20]|nr:MAG: hypothetical protein BRC68_06375 [Halobacteriales archaeon QH_6_64_20]